MRRRLVAGLLLTVLLGGCGMPDEQVTSGSTTTAAPGAGWERLPPPPLSPRGGAILTRLDDGRLLVVGGDTAPGCHDTLSVPAEEPPDTTASGASSGPAVISTSAASCIAPEKDTRLRDGAILESATGAWKPIAEAPAPLSEFSTGVVIGDKVYFWSSPSFATSGPKAGTWMVYDVSADTWKELTAPTIGDYAKTVRAGDRIIGFRGSEEHGESGDLIYDAETDKWSDVPIDPLSPSFDRHMVWAGAEVVLFANALVPNPGADGPSLVRAAAFNPETKEWRRLPDSEIVGGYDTWFSVADLLVNPARQTADGGEVGNYGRHYPHGGILDPATGEWSELPPATQGRADCAADNTGLGATQRERGTGPDVVVLDGWALHVTEMRWQRVPCNDGRADFAYASTWVFDGLVTFGGYDAVAEPGQFPTDYKFKNDAWIWRP